MQDHSAGCLAHCPEAEYLPLGLQYCMEVFIRSPAITLMSLPAPTLPVLLRANKEFVTGGGCKLLFCNRCYTIFGYLHIITTDVILNEIN